MTQYVNQFSQAPVLGSLDLGYSPNTISGKISDSETATLVAGDPVKIENSAGGVPRFLLCTADTDVVFGFVVRNLKKSSFAIGDIIEVASLNNVIYLSAGAAIARGAFVECDVSESEVITSAGVNAICGIALDAASTQSDLIRVYVLAPQNNATLRASYAQILANLIVGANATIGGTLAVTGDASFSANVIKSVNSYSSGAGALPITKDIIALTTGGAETLTLADGVEGQELKIVMISDGGVGTLTPAHFGSGSTLTFDDVGDSAHLVFTNSKWYVIGTPTATLA